MDRVRALADGRRVAQARRRPLRAAIARFAARLDLLVRLDRLHEPEIFVRGAEAVSTGVFRGSESGLFTTAYLHRPAELLQGASDARLQNGALFNVERPGFLVPDFADRWSDPPRHQGSADGADRRNRPGHTRSASRLLLVARR